jgi:transcriptional regulator with XRE-family HTH domain/tetratricopeptide (TPR) repeat protein
MRQKMVNEQLVAARLERHWTQEQACEHLGIPNVRTYQRWETEGVIPSPYFRRKLCEVFGKPLAELGIFPRGRRAAAVQERQAADQRLTADGVLTGRLSEEVLVLSGAEAEEFLARLGADDMAHFDQHRRSAILMALQAVGSASGVVVVVPHTLDPEPWERLSRATTQALNINEQALDYFAALINTCWHLRNAEQTATVARLLPAFLPQIEAIAQQSSVYQKKAAEIATQGYLLPAYIHVPGYMRNNMSVTQRYSKLAVRYSEVAEDFSLRVVALKDHATGALIARKTEEALEIYLRALPFLPFVSALVKSRVYMGMASAYARCGKSNETLARKYLDLAHASYPRQPEDDSSYLYTLCMPPVLHLYDGLTYMDLGRYQDAWDSLEHVNGLTPQLAVPESLRIEVINLQASAAVGLGDLEASLTYVEAGLAATEAQGFNLWQSEAHEVLQQIQRTWPDEPRVKGVAERFHLGGTSL